MKTVIGANGKKCESVGGSCSCCGGSAYKAGEKDCNGRITTEDWYVFRAGWCDSDGVFFSRLCGDKDGIGCITEVKPAHNKANMFAQAMMDIMPGEVDDAIVSEMEDLQAMGMLED